MDGNAKYYIGMVAAILTALAGQADVIPEPWRHYVSVGGIIGVAVNGYLIQRPPVDAMPGGSRASDPPAKKE